ncbi:MAG: sulfite exporter TauE/SafE family protein [Gammaproteobacteria bacterium]|nr:sulfite exporter TauE/SafE family protein [Gammaproteobacteria bacterium]
MEHVTPYLAGFVAGLLGGVHCVGMCGGIVGALTFGIPEERRGRLAGIMPYHLAYNLGRVISYVVAGALMGGLGMLLAQLMPIYYAQKFLYILAGVFMVLLGLYLAGWWMGLGRIEQLGGVLWSRLEPLSRRLLPVRSSAHALLVGAVWGWIPCGLVYTMLVNAVSSGGVLSGAGVMFAFAVGTLPNLLLIGALAGAAARMAQSKVARQLAGVVVLGMGLYTLWQAL